jgi:hypothetical protein
VCPSFDFRCADTYTQLSAQAYNPCSAQAYQHERKIIKRWWQGVNRLLFADAKGAENLP